MIKKAGQMVYVLTALDGKGKNKAWQPVAVVTNSDVAAQWYEYGQNVDWIPLELDDVQAINPENMPTFVPRTTTPGEQKADDLAKQMETTISRLQGIIDQQSTVIKKLQKGQKTSAAEAPLKPMEGGAPFPDVLKDAQEIADFIETYASYDVDNEFIYEKFRGAHAVLKLVDIASLKEGGRDHNQQSETNEKAYAEQDLATQPPALVENGEVLDGNHRLRANKSRGLTQMWCYVVMDGDYGKANV